MGTAEVTGIQGGQWFIRQRFRQALSLGQSQRTERDIGMALNSARPVPERLAVADQHDAGGQLLHQLPQTTSVFSRRLRCINS